MTRDNSVQDRSKTIGKKSEKEIEMGAYGPDTSAKGTI
jgi:hypothetical protein